MGEILSGIGQKSQYNQAKSAYNQDMSGFNQQLGQLGGLESYYGNEMQTGMDPATIAAAYQQYRQQQALNAANIDASSVPNKAGLYEDLNLQGTEGAAALAGNLAGQNQGIKNQAAGALGGISEGIAGYYGNAAGQAQQAMYANNPWNAWGNILNGLGGMATSAFTGGAAGPGGIGSILGGLSSGNMAGVFGNNSGGGQMPTAPGGAPVLSGPRLTGYNPQVPDTSNWTPGTPLGGMAAPNNYGGPNNFNTPPYAPGQGGYGQYAQYGG